MIDADEELLYFAMDYVYENIDFEILNLSLGLCILKNSKKIYDICDKVKQNGKIIISAFDNNGSISYPAAFNNVIGVTSSYDCYNNNDFFIIENDLVNISAKGRSQKLMWLNNCFLVGSGNSYACAHMTGIISKKNNTEDINDFLKKNCKGTILFKDKKKYNKKIYPTLNYKNAVVFPFNKEIHSLIRFSELLLCNLVDVYELKYSAQIGVETNTILQKSENKNFIIKNINNIEWNSFDTFIMGHTDEYLKIIDMKDYKQKLIDEILNHNKNLYSFDNLEKYKIPGDKKHLVFYPKVKQEDVGIAPFGKLYRQSKPVLGIFGTSSKQGKYTLQLKLRKKFIENDYKIFQVGTEPSALLFGMDIVFPIGYNSTVEIYRKDTVIYLNQAINQVPQNIDLIIVGSQSGVVIRDEGNLDNYNFNQVDFLYATQPDAVILCINIFDEFKIIRRTISFIEAAVDCKIIALVVFPFDYKNKNSSYLLLEPLKMDVFNCFKKKAEKEFNIPVYLPDSSDHINKLFNHVIEYFS